MDLRYPIGQYEPKIFSSILKEEWERDIKFLPLLIEKSVQNLDETQLNTPYREGGWTVTQVVHHVADSHVNAYCRFKICLTEESPTTIRPYDEKLWAEMSDTKNLPINISLTLLHALHIRWYEILRNVKDEEWKRTIYHPEHRRTFTLWHLLGSYSWHGRHHVAHISNLRERMGW
jgi:hypothetical protein